MSKENCLKNLRFWANGKGYIVATFPNEGVVALSKSEKVGFNEMIKSIFISLNADGTINYVNPRLKPIEPISAVCERDMEEFEQLYGELEQEANELKRFIK